MELDLDALLGKTLNVKLGGKDRAVSQISLKDYCKALAIRESVGDSVEAAADMLKNMVLAFAPGSFTEKDLDGLTARQLAGLVKKLEQFQSGVEDDGGNPEPGAA